MDGMAKRKTADTKSSDDEDGSGGSGLHPRLTVKLFGHVHAEEVFLRAFEAGTLHHAWLLTGEQGIGKAAFAYRAARFLLSQGASDEGAADNLSVSESHPIARQIAAGAHPSLFVLDDATTAATASIGVDEVRKLRSFLSLTSPGGWRAMIVDPANNLTIASANALLKAIEEPPARTVFFLISHGATAVMPTIRSRCVRLAFRPLNLEDFSKAALAACIKAELKAPDFHELARLHALSAGSPGRALEFIGGGLLPLAETLEKITAGLPDVNFISVHSLIQASGGARNAQAFARLCDLIEGKIEDIARKELAKSPGVGAAWAQLWQSVRQRRLDMEVLNLDKGAFLMSVFSDMEHVARKRS
jgi:DNA polymerase III subunit delta'